MSWPVGGASVSGRRARSKADYARRRSVGAAADAGSIPAASIRRESIDQLMPHELRALLPPPYAEPQEHAKLEHLADADVLTVMRPSDPEDPTAPRHGFGRSF